MGESLSQSYEIKDLKKRGKKMKKKFSKRVVILILVIVIVMIGWICHQMQNRKKYHIPDVSNANYFLLYSKGKYGVIDASGNVLVPADYMEVQIPNPTKAVFFCTSTDNKSVVLNDKKETIFTNYERVSSIPLEKQNKNEKWDVSCLLYQKNGQYGLMNYDGKAITKPEYETITSLPNKAGEFLVQKEGKYCVINPNGVRMFSDMYTQITGDGYYKESSQYAGYIVKNQDKYGYINYNGKNLVKQNYDKIQRINAVADGKQIYLLVWQNGKVGLYHNHKQVMDCQYDEISYNEETQLLSVRNDGKYGVYNIEGKQLVPIDNNDVIFKGKRVTAKKTNNTIEYDLQGNVVKDSKYKMVLSTDDPNYSITVTRDNKYGVINQNGIEVVENKYAYLKYLSNHYFAVYSDDNKMGVIDQNGASVLDMQYDVIQVIENSDLIQAGILNGKKVEIYNKNNMNLIDSLENADLHEEKDDIKLVSTQAVKYISLKGEKITLDTKYQNVAVIPYVENGKWGFKDKNGQVKLVANYDRITDFSSAGFAGIQQKGVWGVINQKGEIVVSPSYHIDSSTTEPEFAGKYFKVNQDTQSYYTDDIK